jgi:hypothetical protein
LVRDAHRLGPQYLACSIRKAKHTHLGYMIKLSRLCSLDLPLAPAITRGSHLVERTPKQKLDHRPPASTASTNADGAKTIIVMISPPIRRLAVTTTAKVMPMSLRLPRQEGVEADVLQGELQWFCIIVPPSLCGEKLG